MNVVPVVSERGQQFATINSIASAANIGVTAEKIRLVTVIGDRLSEVAHLEKRSKRYDKLISSGGDSAGR